MKRLAVSILILALGFFLLRTKESAETLRPSPPAGKTAVEALSSKGAQAVSPSLGEPAKAGTEALPPAPKEESRQAVLDWSADVGRGMLDAFRDPGKADRMFSFLRSCAEDQSLGMVYRAVCAGNAKRLADRFPDRYSQNYGGFQRGLPERLRDFLAQADTDF